MTALPHTIIAKAISKSELSQKDAAQQMGISPAYLSDIGSGKRKISVPFAKKAEEVLKVDGFALLERQLLAEWKGEI
jgi:ribosome-binding protein aMBF1 (putative translation factor)